LTEITCEEAYMKVKPSKEGTNFETSFRYIKIAPVDTKEDQEGKAK
jgi:hypothetical protein